ncbi:MAG: hypothetical protein Q8M92_06900 [Candidatus Subteraquimicrobiales bacterium]|nr:hypothetical protein [Thermodesulfobacteriota bacterium]MDP3013950.1 hypothetical protein [Candidatus Subteraquimicrobiales bacterium]
MMDMAGPWGCGNICAQNGIVRDILSKLQDFETMTWAGLEAKTGLKGKQNHLMPVDKICKEARDRLKKIKLDDLDELYSFRLSGMKRLWGKRENEIFYVIWWDPKHTVYPVQKKHT